MNEKITTYDTKQYMYKYHHLKKLSPIELLDDEIWNKLEEDYFFYDKCLDCGCDEPSRLLSKGEIELTYLQGNTEELCERCLQLRLRTLKLNKIKNKIYENSNSIN